VTLIALPLVILLQVMPPPLGLLASTLILGSAVSHTDVIVSVPLPGPPTTPAQDGNCGVPASPRGPR